MFEEGTRDARLRADGFLPAFKSLKAHLMVRYSFVAQEPESLCRCRCENLSKSAFERFLGSSRSALIHRCTVRTALAFEFLDASTPQF